MHDVILGEVANLQCSNVKFYPSYSKRKMWVFLRSVFPCGLPVCNAVSSMTLLCV